MKKIIGTLLCMITLTTSWSQTGETIDKIVGVVGNEIILKSEVELQALSQTEGAAVGDEVRCGIMEEILFNKILIHQARIDSIEVDDAMVQSEIERRLDYYIQVFGSVEGFEEYYGKSVTEWRAEFEDPIRENLLAQRMRQSLLSSVKVTPGEVRDFYNSLPKDSLPLINSTIEYSQIIITPEVSKENKRKTYEFMDSLRNFIASGGTSMGVESAKWSEDPGSRYKLGCYPMQSKGSFVPEYEAAVYNTGERGYSQVFETEYGYHFVYVKKILGDRYEACHILKSPKPSEEDIKSAELEIQEAYSKLKSKEIKFGEAVLEYSNDENTMNQKGKVISNNSGSPKLELKEIDPNINFILDQLEEGELSEPVLIQIPGQNQSSWAIFRVDKRTDAHVANMEIDYQIFQQQKESVKKSQVIDKWMKEEIAQTYIRLEDEYMYCNYQFDWTKQGTSESNKK